MVRMTLDDGRVVSGAELLVAVGRRPSAAGLGLHHYGLTGLSVRVDPAMWAAEGLWAVGDVTGLGAFTTSRCISAALPPPTSLASPLPPSTRSCPG